ncbi:MAG: cytochrome-c oxidase, partial [Microvirga sp.]
MASTLAVLAVLAVLAARWLSHQGLATKPWLEPGIGAGGGRPGWPAAAIGLAVFLAVAACLFGLVLSAFSMRMQVGFWRPLPASGLLWVNTAALVAAGAALQWA